jgi:hypothetical protein
MILHPFDPVAKSYFISSVLFASIAIIASSYDACAVSRISALVVALNACLCLIGIMFADGFTNTPGRSAGFFVNPNVAAAALLLGVTGTAWSVPRTIRPSFIILVGGGILATLSRSTLFAGITVATICTAVSVLRHGFRPLNFRTPGFWVAPVLSLCLPVWFLIAIHLNDRFEIAFLTAVRDSGRIGIVLAKATESITKAPEINSNQVLAEASHGEGSLKDTPLRTRATLLATRKLTAEMQVAERTSSVSARGLAFERALVVYMESPLIGSGLARAHQLEPHNTILLLGVAFGLLGLIIAFLIVLVALVLAGFSGLHLAFGLSLAFLLFASHDILLVPALSVVLGIGYSGLLSRDRELSQIPATIVPQWPIARTVVAGVLVFCLASILVLLRHPYINFNIAPNDTTHYDRNAYLTNVHGFQFAGYLRGTHEQLSFIENETVLANHPSEMVSVETLGNGRFWIGSGRFRETLLFSASDNTDPRKNGYQYRFYQTARRSPLAILTIFLVVAWCAVVTSFLGAKRLKLGESSS